MTQYEVRYSKGSYKVLEDLSAKGHNRYIVVKVIPHVGDGSRYVNDAKEHVDRLAREKVMADE